MRDLEQLFKKYILFGILLIPLSASALTREKQLINTTTGVNTSIGILYNSGDYGTGVNNTVLTIPFDIYYRTGNWNLGISTSYLTTKGTGTTLPTYGGMFGRLRRGRQSSGGASTTVTYSGLGDTVASVNYILSSFNTATSTYYVTGKVKFPTADEAKYLGTGELDYNAEFGVYFKNHSYDIYSFGGYQITGEPTGTPLKNVLYGTLGFSYILQNNKNVGAKIYASESILPGGNAPVELDFLFRSLIDKNRWLNGFAGIGLTDGSPDWTAGFTIEFAF